MRGFLRLKDIASLVANKIHSPPIMELYNTCVTLAIAMLSAFAHLKSKRT